jgi:hypothetical protein
VEHNNDPAAAAASVDHAAHAGLLDDLMARVAPCFARRETRLTCRDMVNGLLRSPSQRSGFATCTDTTEPRRRWP